MSQCSRCGATFGCAMADPGAAEPCWCTALPPAVPLPRAAGAGCWCPACLKKHIDEQTPPAAGAADMLSIKNV